MAVESPMDKRSAPKGGPGSCLVPGSGEAVGREKAENEGFRRERRRREAEETSTGGGRKCEELADWDSHHETSEAVKTMENWPVCRKNGYKEEKLRLRDYRRTGFPYPWDQTAPRTSLGG